MTWLTSIIEELFWAAAVEAENRILLWYGPDGIWFCDMQVHGPPCLFDIGHDGPCMHARNNT